jgi:hypothetical protein
MRYQQEPSYGTRRRYLEESEAAEAERDERAYEAVQKDDLSGGMSRHQAKALTHQYGTVGPLPSTLKDRNARMQAYQARYVATGGDKLSAWTHRAHVSDQAKTAALGAGTLAGAASLALRTKAGAKVGRKARTLITKVPHAPKEAKTMTRERATHHSDLAAGGAAVVGGGNELYGDYARKRRADARSTPAGVAAGALRRMQAYTPGGTP